MISLFGALSLTASDGWTCGTAALRDRRRTGIGTALRPQGSGYAVRP